MVFVMKRLLRPNIKHPLDRCVSIARSQWERNAAISVKKGSTMTLLLANAIHAIQDAELALVRLRLSVPLA